MNLHMIAQAIGELARFSEKGKVFLPNGVLRDNLREQQFIVQSLLKQALAVPAPGTRYCHGVTKEKVTVILGISSSANRVSDSDEDNVLCLTDTGQLLLHEKSFFLRMFKPEE